MDGSGLANNKKVTHRVALYRTCGRNTKLYQITAPVSRALNCRNQTIPSRSNYSNSDLTGFARAHVELLLRNIFFVALHLLAVATELATTALGDPHRAV